MLRSWWEWGWRGVLMTWGELWSKNFCPEHWVTPASRRWNNNIAFYPPRKQECLGTWVCSRMVLSKQEKYFCRNKFNSSLMYLDYGQGSPVEGASRLLCSQSWNLFFVNWLWIEFMILIVMMVRMIVRKRMMRRMGDDDEYAANLAIYWLFVN